MSASVIKIGNDYNAPHHYEIQISNESDLTGLSGYAVGSLAYLDDLSKFWMLSADGVWKEI